MTLPGVLMRHQLRFSAIFCAALLAGCTEQLTAPDADRSPTAQSFTILDGAHGGNAGFYFLPPMVPPPTYSGTFDGSKSPVVQICELSGTSCGPIVATFSGSQVKVDLLAEAYQAKWKTRGAGLDPAKTYRIQVLVETQVLGYADVVVLANGSQIKTIDKNQFVTVINGGTLAIRFRIEGGATCTPGTSGCGWNEGDFRSWGQFNWDSGSAAVTLLTSNYGSVYALLGGLLEVGIVGLTTYSMSFTSASTVLAYLPATGPNGPLTSDLINPTSSASGGFGGDVVALTLNIDFSDDGLLTHPASVAFGDLLICDVTPSALNGTSLRQLLATANTLLAGSSAAYSIAEIAPIINEANIAFVNGLPSAWAQLHLFNGACPTPG